MVITKIEIENIRSLEKVVWEIEPGQAKGWHVILGDNGAGKSTFLRAVALALVGPMEAAALRQNWREWLRFDMNSGGVQLQISGETPWDLAFESNNSKLILPEKFGAGIQFSTLKERSHKTVTIESHRQTGRDFAKRGLWIYGELFGWFSASYGPFRRFKGGDREAEQIYNSHPDLARHLSVFGENAALTEVVQWLKDLKFKSLEETEKGGLLERAKHFINQPGFLPHGVRLNDISSEGVHFIDAELNPVQVEDLSDGYRSILSMTFEIIRQITRTYGRRPEFYFAEDNTQIIAPGVVLIDEIDVHLHPSWQREVGHWFRKHFPNIQFIVTTHSPLVCQAASGGSIFRLPRPGSDEAGRMVEGIELERLLNGDISEAYDTEAFGLHLTRSDDSQQALERLAELNVLELRQGLSEPEKTEQERLRAAMPTTTNIISIHSNGNAEEKAPKVRKRRAIDVSGES